MYLPKCIMSYLVQNYTGEKRKFYYDITGDHLSGFSGVGSCEEFLQKLTETVIKAAKEHNVPYPKEWDEIIPLDYFRKKYKGYEEEMLMKTRGK